MDLRFETLLLATHVLKYIFNIVLSREPQNIDCLPMSMSVAASDAMK